tara:strand:+ start:2874 stop:3500 length:627 start_codon:yes stop_codon:yes gene_type:complete
MNKNYFYLSILLALPISLPVQAEGACDTYPRPGFDILREDNGEEKFIATAEVTVPIDDRDLYLDSMEEAEIEAKMRIAKFLNENISGSTDIEKNSKTKVRVEGDTKSVNSEMVRTKLKKLSSKTPKTLMRGVRVLGSCYTPGQAVRVSVGWKLQDLESAEKMRNTMNRNNPNNFYGNKKRKQQGSNGNSNVDFNPVGGYSDTDRLRDF